MNTVLRSADYKKAVDVLVQDQTVIYMAKDVSQSCYPEVINQYWFARQALNQYIHLNGKNVDAANHHIGAVAEAIREINKW